MSTEESSSSTKLSQGPSPSRRHTMDSAASGTAGQLLTTPSEPRGNHGWDNQHSDLIVCTHDVLFNELTNNSYLAVNKLGQGTFGQVVQCWSEYHRCFVAVKIIKNQAAYHQQAMVEVKILQSLNRDYNAERYNFVQLLDYFRFKNHLCLVFELLQRNLFELIQFSGYQGFSLGLVNHFIKQVLQTLTVLRREGIIHADLKPENVLLEDEKTGVVKVIDFGSSCMEHETVYSYIQSRFYRSPEVVLAYPYDSAIDMWSLGCIAAELYLGLPLFPAASERDLLARMIEILGPFPIRMLAASRRVRRYFKLKPAVAAASYSSGGEGLQEDYHLMTQSEFEEHNREAAPTARKYFQYSTLQEIVTKCKTPSRNNPPEDPRCFLDFLSGLLQIDPQRRWNAEQAVAHPFITGTQFVGPFHPPPTASRQKSRPVGIGAMQNARYHSASWHPNAAAHSIAHEAAMLAVSQLTNSVASNSSQLAQWTGSMSTVNNGTLGVSPETSNNPIMMAAMRAAKEAFSNPSCPSSFQSTTQPVASPGRHRIQGFHVAPRQQTNGDVSIQFAERPQGQTHNGNRMPRPMADINENGPQVDEGGACSFDLDLDTSSQPRTQPRNQLPSNCTSSKQQQQQNNNNNASSVGMDGRTSFYTDVKGSGVRAPPRNGNGVAPPPANTGQTQWGPGQYPRHTPIASDRLYGVMGSGAPSSLPSQHFAPEPRQGTFSSHDCRLDRDPSEKQTLLMDGPFSFLGSEESLLSSTFSSQSEPWNEGISNDDDDDSCCNEADFYGSSSGRIENGQQQQRICSVDSAEVQLDVHTAEWPLLVDDASDL